MAEDGRVGVPDPRDARLRGPHARPRQRARGRRAHDLHQAQGRGARRGHARRTSSRSTSRRDHDNVGARHAPGDGAAHRGLQAPAGRAQRRARPPALRDGVRRDRRAVRLPDPRQRAVRRRHLDLRRRARPDHRRPPGRARSRRRSAAATRCCCATTACWSPSATCGGRCSRACCSSARCRLQAIAASLGPLHPIPNELLAGHPLDQVPGRTSRPSTGTRGCASCAAADAPSACPGSASERRDRDRADRQRRRRPRRRWRRRSCCSTSCASGSG